MGVSVDSGGKGVDVEINLVPFIDLMSCLVAFLLVTAAWTNLAQMPVKPKGVGRDAEKNMPTEKPLNISMLVAKDQVWLGTTAGDLRQIKKEGDDYKWSELADTLNEFKTSIVVFKDREDIELAAEDGVTYQTIISAMDTAIHKGFKDVGFVDPNSLSVKFKQ